MHRRRFLAAFGGALLAGCAAPARDPTSSGQETTGEPPGDGGTNSWQVARHDPANTGSNPASAGPVENDRDWESFLDGNITEAPTIQGDTLYCGAEKSIYAIATDDGSKRWTQKLPFRTDIFSPAVSAETVYAMASDTTGGTLFALDRSTGERKWSFEVVDPTSPMLVDGTVYFGDTAEQRGAVVAVDAERGREQWRFTVRHREQSGVAALPAVVDDTLYCLANTSDGDRESPSTVRLHALDAADGARRWTFTTEGRTSSAPVVDAESVYFTNHNGQVHAVDTRSETERWTHEGEKTFRSSPAVSEGTVFAGSMFGTFYALDGSDGSVQWTAETSIENVDPSVDARSVYVGGTELYVLDRDTGETRWRFDISGTSTTFYSPIVTDDALYHGVCLKIEPRDPYDNYVYKVSTA